MYGPDLGYGAYANNGSYVGAPHGGGGHHGGGHMHRGGWRGWGGGWWGPWGYPPVEYPIADQYDPFYATPQNCVLYNGRVYCTPQPLPPAQPRQIPYQLAAQAAGVGEADLSLLGAALVASSPFEHPINHTCAGHIALLRLRGVL